MQLTKFLKYWAFPALVLLLLFAAAVWLETRDTAPIEAIW